MSLFKKLFGSLNEEELKNLFLEIDNLISSFNEFQNKSAKLFSSNVFASDTELLDTSEELEFIFKKIRLNFYANQIKPTRGQTKDLFKIKKFYEEIKKGQELGKEKFKERFKNNSKENNIFPNYRNFDTTELYRGLEYDYDKSDELAEEMHSTLKKKLEHLRRKKKEDEK